MQTFDTLLAIVYVGLMMSMQINTLIKLYKSTTGHSIARCCFALTFVMVSQYTQLKNNKDFRRGYMTALYVAPCVFFLTGLNYCLIANLVFIIQGLLYAYIGKVLVVKHTTLTA